jgi:hypothetical protein
MGDRVILGMRKQSLRLSPSKRSFDTQGGSFAAAL